MIRSGNATTFKINAPSNATSIFFAAALVGMTIFGCSEQHGTGSQFSRPPTPVESAEAVSQKVVDRFDAVGTIEADEAVSIVSEIDAAVVSLPFEEGSVVKRGELIAHLDDT